jgi:hypothetical protein
MLIEHQIKIHFVYWAGALASSAGTDPGEACLLFFGTLVEKHGKSPFVSGL